MKGFGTRLEKYCSITLITYTLHSWSYPVLLVLQKGLKFVSNANQKQAKALNNITHFLTNVLFYLYLSDFNCKNFAPLIFKNWITKKKRKKSDCFSDKMNNNLSGGLNFENLICQVVEIGNFSLILIFGTSYLQNWGH